ncbi:dephospho-CoA kinase [Denitrovibrio acetiphilus DSM 12809]|uniref:Dephospho-CoA kinase n=1 Tax=Denitrovibrio acetiphilus (strain DSM 12809 / NBRC 114555 / N2460) TaxID=522772 RepID=D4H3S5_DENA2|nr:dephospho-CoA kinase [Denitrovibrio acetiphilus]ADD69177.1 dephospho-CoA kinase [Denitrovibrio acetiphilus DSM 12809]
MYLGLTGNIASGKSTAAKFFEELGCYILDTDDISRIVMQPGQKAYGSIVELFGEDVLNDDKTLNRKAIRKIVFNDPVMLKKLEQIVHPAIGEYERKEIGRIKGRDDKAVIITQAAVTVEAGSQDRFDKLIVVYTDPETQLKRVMERDNITEEDAKKIINAQMPLDEKLKFAHYVIDNSGDLDNLRADVERVFELIKLTKYGMKNK